MSEKSTSDSPLSFSTGMGLVPRAVATMLASPKLMGLAILPALISVAVLSGLIIVSVLYGGDVIALFWKPSQAWNGWTGWLWKSVYWLAQLLSIMVLIALSGVFTLLVSLIVAEPFADLLSEGTEKRMGSLPAEDQFSLRQFAGEMGYALRDISLDLALLAVLQLGLLLLLLIPVAGAVLHIVLQWLVNASFASVEMMSGALGRRGCHGIARWRILMENPGVCLGLGTSCIIILLVPLAQLLSFPVAVIAGTICVAELARRGRVTDLRGCSKE